jgi:hypothetical protein
LRANTHAFALLLQHENSNIIAHICDHTNRKRWYAVCMERAVAYYRVSTRQQHRSGLGIEAQRAAVTRFAEAEKLQIIAEFVETESGKGSDALDRRP